MIAGKKGKKGSEPFSNDKPADDNEAWAEKGSDPFFPMGH
jgi:hypothetical protein